MTGRLHQEQLSELRRAVALADRLPYDEPPLLYASPRLALGRALLRGGEAQAAQEAFEAELAVYPGDGWGLWGLQQACGALRNASCAAAAEQRRVRAWRHADVTLDVAAGVSEVVPARVEAAIRGKREEGGCQKAAGARRSRDHYCV